MDAIANMIIINIPVESRRPREPCRGVDRQLDRTPS